MKGGKKKELTPIQESMKDAKELVLAAIGTSNKRSKAVKQIQDALLKEDADTAAWRTHLMKALFETIVKTEDNPPQFISAFRIIFESNTQSALTAIKNLPTNVPPIFYGAAFICDITDLLFKKQEREQASIRRAIALFEALGPTLYVKYAYNPSILTTYFPNLGERFDITEEKSHTSRNIINELKKTISNKASLQGILDDKDHTKARDLFFIMLSELGPDELVETVRKTMGDDLKQETKVLLHHIGCTIPEIEEEYNFKNKPGSKFIIRKPQRRTIEHLVEAAETWEDFDNVLDRMEVLKLCSHKIYQKLNKKFISLISESENPAVTHPLYMACGRHGKYIPLLYAQLIHDNYDKLNNHTLEFDIGYAYTFKRLLLGYPTTGLISKQVQDSTPAVKAIQDCTNEDELEKKVKELACKAAKECDIDMTKALLQLELTNIRQVLRFCFYSITLTPENTDENHILKDSKHREFISALQKNNLLADDKAILRLFEPSDKLYPKAYAIICHPSIYTTIADIMQLEKKYENFVLVQSGKELRSPHYWTPKTPNTKRVLADKNVFEGCIQAPLLYGILSYGACKLLGYMFTSSSIAQCMASHKEIIAVAIAGFGAFYKIAENIGPARYVQRYNAANGIA